MTAQLAEDILLSFTNECRRSSFERGSLSLSLTLAFWGKLVFADALSYKSEVTDGDSD